jgi:hypothetical protein
MLLPSWPMIVPSGVSKRWNPRHQEEPAYPAVWHVDLLLVHSRGCAGREHPGAVACLAVLQVHPGEGQQAAGAHRQHRAGRDVGTHQRPHRCRVEPSAGCGLEVTDGGTEQDRVVRAGRSMSDAERLDQVLMQARVVRLAAQYLDQSAEDREPGVVVRPHRAGGEQLRDVVENAEVLLDAVVADAGVGEDVALEARRVGKQMADRDPARGVLVGDPELRQVRAEGRVEVDRPLVDKLHHQRAGPQLGDRADLEHRLRRRSNSGAVVEDTRRMLDDVTTREHRDPPRRARRAAR